MAMPASKPLQTPAAKPMAAPAKKLTRDSPAARCDVLARRRARRRLPPVRTFSFERGERRRVANEPLDQLASDRCVSAGGAGHVNKSSGAVLPLVIADA
jgi:hypothetical protein